MVSLMEPLFLSFDLDKEFNLYSETIELPDDLLLSPSRKMMQLIEKNWSTHVYISALCPRIFRLTLQVMLNIFFFRNDDKKTQLLFILRFF
jgi:hypothetical protein